jgi:Family of unknown function (DUF6350)
MTDLLDRPRTRSPQGDSSREGALRSPAVTAAAAGLASAAVVLSAAMAVGLVAWYASDAGAHGDTRDAIRVGADAWLLALGSHLHLATGAVTATVTAVPLGLTLLCVYAAHRFGRWAARSSPAEDARTVALSVLVMSAVYGSVALGCAVLASTAEADPGLLRSFAGGFLVALAGGGTGLLRGSGKVAEWRARVPEGLRAIALGAAGGALLLVAAASVLVAVALLMDLGTAANVLSRLHAGASGGLLYTALVAAVTPNAVLLGASYLLGPGFAVGAGTLVSPGLVTLGPVPAFPLLAALPDPGTPPAWLAVLVAAPVLASVLGVALMMRRFPVLGYATGALRGAGAGLLGGLLVSVLVALAGGAVGPGRMTAVGADLLDTVLSAAVAMGFGGLVAGVAATWWAHRR